MESHSDETCVCVFVCVCVRVCTDLWVCVDLQVVSMTRRRRTLRSRTVTSRGRRRAPSARSPSSAPCAWMEATRSPSPAPSLAARRDTRYTHTQRSNHTQGQQSACQVSNSCLEGSQGYRLLLICTATDFLTKTSIQIQVLKLWQNDKNLKCWKSSSFKHNALKTNMFNTSSDIV